MPNRFAYQVLSPAEPHPIQEFLFQRSLAIALATVRSLKTEQQKILKHTSVSFQSLYSLDSDRPVMICPGLHRKEVIQPHLPIRLPCYDLTPIIEPTFDGCLLAVSSPASGVFNFHGLTGGVYKARERIHRGMLIRDY